MITTSDHRPSILDSRLVAYLKQSEVWGSGPPRLLPRTIFTKSLCVLHVLAMQPYFGLRGALLNRAIIWLVVCPAFVCYGYNQGVTGGLLTLESFARQFPQMNTLTTKGAEQHYNSTIQVLMATSFELAQFIVARLVLGVGTGGYVATVPVWQAEISQAKKRGAHVVTDGIFIGAGIAISLWIDFGFYFVKGNSVSWRFPLAFQVVLSVIVMLFITVFPESPRWLVKRGRVEEAREILAALADQDPHSEDINMALADIERSLALSGSGSWKDMLTMGEQRLFHRTVLAATGQMFQQMCGINLITFYATTIFEQYLGLSPIQSRILAASMTLTQPLGGFLAFFTIDRLGRRPLMLWSAVGMSASMAILGGTTSVTDNTGTLVAAVVFLFVFEFIFTVGYSGLTFLYATEVAPLQLRAAISAVSTAAVWTFNFLLAEVTPVGFNTISYKYYIIFAVLNAAIVPVVYFFFPETNGRTLEEIDEIFLRSKTIFDPPRLARTLPKMHLAEDVEIEGGNESGGSWSNPVGPYQWYIHGSEATANYLEVSADFKNPADESDEKGIRISIDDTSSWNGQTMMRSELIPQTDADLGSGTLFYHFSLQSKEENAPVAALEHQIAFFELKYGGDEKTLRWLADGKSQWSTDLVAGTWYNFAYEIDFSAKTVGLWTSTGAEALKKVVEPVSAATQTDSKDWHVGELRLDNGQKGGKEDWFWSGVYIEKGEITTAIAGPAA
ncbi:unnamed protein product [Aspergillus oryzae var. brunneus]|uniref:Unnamed protein product n=2 Tax=Aspergillus oryzae TaxID=5062 RepID=A0AAN4YJU4_ASPOZ|nr:unnamed protein product [Aspergillus oryzae]GMG43426.1 unnamed protein product [Aspergillus oryzae var. brunneus]